MADEPTLGELYRLLQAHQREAEQRTANLNAEIGRRVREDLFELVRKGQDEKITDVRRDLDDLISSPRRRRAELIAWAGLLVAVVAVLVTVYAATKGAGR